MFDGSTAMCFHPSSRPLQVVGGANRSRASIKTRPFALAAASSSAKPSPVILQGDRNDGGSGSKRGDLGSSLMGSPSSAPVFSQANTVGVLGGVSAVSTLHFLEKLVGWSSREGEESPPFIVCSDPGLSREVSSRGRDSFPHRGTRSTCFWFNRPRLVGNLRHKREFLELSGARCIVLPCHLSHSWHREISEGCSVPFLHVGECVAEELKAADLRPVEAGSSVRIGVLAADATLAAGFYQEKLQNLGFEVVLPDKATMEHTFIPAVEALNRKDMEGARTLLRIALQVLLVRAVNTVILASEDMQGLLPLDDPLLKKCVDPMDALVRSTIEWARSTENLHTNT
uniref:Putative amino-acid racemase n=1 Tax=Anthurium amnicola TaxID=1678845 RepID=A0A1D1XCX0_9ARAE